MSYVTGNVIKELREQKHMTQKQLAEQLHVSDKTVSKWEVGRGLPDVELLVELASALGVSVAELLAGEYAVNGNRSGNMKKTVFYVCPVCGNIIQAAGEGAYSCCGIALPPLEPEHCDEEHEIRIEQIDNEYYVSMAHDMTKSHSISFFAYVTSNTVQLLKLYPEQNAEGRFARRGHGYVYAYCNRHGLFRTLL